MHDDAAKPSFSCSAVLFYATAGKPRRQRGYRIRYRRAARPAPPKEGVMARGFDANRFNRELRAAERKAQSEWKREVDRVSRESKRRVDAYNRKVDQHNRQVLTNYNRKVDAHNRAVVADLDRQLRAALSGPR
jgi:hypothetical protein